MAKPIPQGYHTVTPSIVVEGAARALDFYKQALGAEELYRMPTPDGKIMHAEVRIGDSIIMLSDPFPQSDLKPPQALGATTTNLHIYCADADQAFKRAVGAGATVRMEPQTMFWGDRYATVVDPFGHSWSFATHVEDVSPQEMQERAKQMFKDQPGGP